MKKKIKLNAKKLFPQKQTLEHQFMPAVLEITQTPPSPIGRLISYSIMAFFAIVVLLVCLTHIDIVAVGTGKIISSGKIKLIQPLKSGVVDEIRVKDGQVVQKGDILVKLQFEEAQNNRQRLEQELLFARLDKARYSALVGDNPIQEFQLPSDIPADLAVKTTNLFKNDLAKLDTDTFVLDGQISEMDAQIKVLQAEIQKVERAIPNLKETVQIKKTLLDEQLVSKIQYLDLERMLIEYQETLKVNRQRLNEATRKKHTLMVQRQQIRIHFKNEMAYKLQEALNKESIFFKELENARWIEGLSLIRAPEDGVIQEMEIHTVGGIVTPAQTLMKLAPVHAELQVEATLLNKDIGFVKPGQKARLKIDSFPYTKYGFINGRILFISKDAVIDEELGPIYQMRISMEKDFINVDGQDIKLSPGMTVVAEIKTGKRRIIEFILAPFIKYKSESMRER